MIEVDIKTEIKDLLDPRTWDPQCLVKRGDRIRVMREDDNWCAEMMCVSSTAGFPIMTVLTYVPLSGSKVDEAVTIEQAGDGSWRALAAGVTIVEAESEEAVREALNAELAEKAA